MRLHGDIQYRNDYLQVRASGRWTREGMLSLIERVAKDAEEHDCDRVLGDLREVTAPPSDIDRFYAGERIAQAFGSKVRIAVVYDPIHTTGLAENAAVNRGANMRVFADLDEALSWLLEDLPGTVGETLGSSELVCC